MNEKLRVTLASGFYTLGLILIEYFSGGVVTHYPLADDSLPGITNWWGMITIPLLAWITMTVIEKRKGQTDAITKNPFWLGGLIFGFSVGLLLEFRLEQILQFYIILPWVFALFLKIYRIETLLGFALGMLYTFGGVLPIAIGSILQLVGFILFWVIHYGTTWIFSKGHVNKGSN